MDNLPVNLQGLNPRYFWDVEPSTLHAEHSKRLIIERVFNRGSLADMKVVISYYGEKNTIDVLCKLNYLDPKTLNFISKLFDIPQENFQCYIRKQSTHLHWNS